MLTGLPPDTDAARIRAEIEPHFGTIERVEIVREGTDEHPWAILHMYLDDEAAFRLTQRITDIWHQGHRVNARLLLHT